MKMNLKTESKGGCYVSPRLSVLELRACNVVCTSEPQRQVSNEEWDEVDLSEI